MAKVQLTRRCWLWRGRIGKSHGYGCFRVGRRIMQAHRVSWRLFRGPIPGDLFVLHRCDVPRCVNPDHLWLGTHQDNMDDMARKGRRRALRGERNGSSKLVASQVREIKRRSRTDRGVDLAREFGVSASLVSQILSGKLWPHVDG